MKINKKNLIASTSAIFFFLTASIATAASTWGPPSKPGGVPDDIEGGLMNMTNWILGFVSMVAVLFVIWGGVQYLTSAGEEEKAKNGKKTVTYAFMGLVVCALAYAVVEVIVAKILA